MEAFELYLYRRILCIPWVQRVTNEEVLRRMGKQKGLTIKQRKTSCIGHVMRDGKYEFLRLIIEGKIQGNRSTFVWIRRLKKKNCIWNTVYTYETLNFFMHVSACSVNKLLLLQKTNNLKIPACHGASP